MSRLPQVVTFEHAAQVPRRRIDGRDPVRRVRGWLAPVLAVAALTSACSTSPSASPSTETTAPIRTVPVVPKPGPAVLLPGSQHEEIEQFGADTFTDYRNASGVGPYLPIGAVVEVDCLATGPEAAAPTVHGRWYHFVAPKGYAGYFAAANTFENGDTSPSGPAVDAAVPPCPTTTPA